MIPPGPGPSSPGPRHAENGRPMSETRPTDHAAALLFSAVLHPHRSLSLRGVRLVVVLSPRGVDVSDVVSVVSVGGGTSMPVVDGVTDV